MGLTSLVGGYMRDHGYHKLGGRLTAVKREKYAKVKQSTSKSRLSFSLF